MKFSGSETPTLILPGGLLMTTAQMMRRVTSASLYSLLVLSLATPVALGAPPETGTTADAPAPAPGFVELFNGKDLSGWASVNCGSP
jgi:hypothetical protein